MPSATLERRRTKSGGWWGDGPPPGERWLGVTIPLPAAWRSNRERWESPDGAYWFDVEAADRACRFFPTYLRHYIGEFAGQPFTLLDYQRMLLTRPLFGWKRASDGSRRFRKVFAFLPKASGKSPWGSATGLYLAFCDREAGAEVYSVAADKKQARVVHNQARFMVETMSEIEPEFLDLFTVYRDSIECAETHSTFEVISADAGTKHGFRPHGVIFDELHAQRNRLLYEALKRSMVKRRQPLMVLLSHAGYDDEGICAEEYDLAKRVLSGSVPMDECLPVIFEADRAEDWTSPAVWERVNPGHGVTVKHDGLVAECAEALAEPRKRNDFLRFHLNIWTSQATAWIPIEWWDSCAAPEFDVLGLRCAAGLDLAQKWDLACFALIFKRPLVQPTEAIDVVAETAGEVIKRTVALNFEIMIQPYFWIPENTLAEHEKQDGVPYRLWADAGLITITEGDVIDYARIYQDITEKILPRYPALKEGVIGYDPAFATDLATKLRDLAGLKIEEVLQNYRDISEPAQVFEALVKGKRVKHDGNRLLRWNIENMAVKRDDAGRIRPVKARNAAKRIDGGVASIMGLKMLMLMPEPKRSKYAEGAPLLVVRSNQQPPEARA